MKINLIIATYSGMYGKFENNPNKKNYLKYNLNILNTIKSNVTQISIMKPKVNDDHIEIKDYYNFENINIDKIKEKIKIFECDNIGISYGQYFAGIAKTLDFDYHFWLEDDYIICKDYFEKDLLNEFVKHDQDSHLCPFIYTNIKWDIVPYSKQIDETDSNIELLKTKLQKYDAESISCNVPDMMQLGVLSKHSVKRILDKFESFGNIKNFFDIPFTKIWLHQILFGYILHIAGVKIYDTANKYLNIFYETSINAIYLCNYPEYVNTWKDKSYNNEKLELPLCLPIDMLHPSSNYDNDLQLMKKYMSNEDDFFAIYKKINMMQKRCMVAISENIVIREIEGGDYNGYMNIMYEFANYKYTISYDEFISYIETMNNFNKILVVYSRKQERIIGAGTIFKLSKLHNNPVGQIEDFIITENYRHLGIGHLLSDKLVNIGKFVFKCYKIVLNCQEKNIGFYEDCNFCKESVQMKKNIFE